MSEWGPLARGTREALANFIESSSGPGHAFVKNEFLSDKTGKCRLAVDPGFQFVKPARSSFALCACESHVGVIGTGLGDESAKARRSSDTLLQ